MPTSKSVRVYDSNNTRMTRYDLRKKKKSKKRRANPFKKYVTSPKGYVSIILVLLMGLGEFHDSGHKGLINAGIAVGVALVFDFIVGLIQKRKNLFPDGGIVTALIISLVLSSMVPMYQVILITIIALISKHLIVINRKPVFNPAAFGLLVAIYLFHSGQSWWGGLTSLPSWCIAFVIIGGYVISKKVNKFPQVFSFLGVTFALFLTIHLRHMGHVNPVFRPPFINSTLFLAFFMLTDPPTSPGKYRDQVLFGALTAFVSVMMYVLTGGLSYLLIGLLTANAWKAVAIRKKSPVKNKGKATSGRRESLLKI